MIEIKFACKWTQVRHRLAIQPKPIQCKLSDVNLQQPDAKQDMQSSNVFVVVVFFCDKRATQGNSLVKTCQLATTCESVWPELKDLK